MRAHRIQTSAVPSESQPTTRPTWKKSAYTPGGPESSIEPAKTFKEIAEALNVPVETVRRDYIRAMTKLGWSDRLFEIWFDFETSHSRRTSTPFARTMRVGVIDVAPSQLNPIAEVQP